MRAEGKEFFGGVKPISLAAGCWLLAALLLKSLQRCKPLESKAVVFSQKQWLPCQKPAFPALH